MSNVRRALVNAGLLFTDEDVAMIQATASPFSLDMCRLIASHPAMTVRSLVEAKQAMQLLLDDARKYREENEHANH